MIKTRVEALDNQLVIKVSSTVELGAMWEAVAEGISGDFPGLRMGVLVTGDAPRDSVSESDSAYPIFRLVATNPSLHSSDSLSRYLQFIGADSFQQTRYVALKLLNRRDFTGTFRLIDRETMFTSCVLAAIDLLLETRPRLVVFDVTPHEFFDYVVWSVADWLGIPVLFFQPCPIVPAMLARTNLEKVIVPEGGSVADSIYAKQYAELARTRLEKLDKGVDPHYMERQKDRDRAVSRLSHKWLALQAIIRWLWTERFPESIDFSGHHLRHGVFVRALKILLGRSLQSTLRKAVLGLGQSPQPPGDYCVFALHYEPERTSLPDGLPIDFQADAIIAARTLMPESFNLVVKEHYSQQTSALRGFLGRSPDFYGLIESFPRTHFASSTDRLSELILGSKGVFTLTGTVAIEAVLRGVPVVYFGHPWWEGLPGTFRIEDIRSFTDIGRTAMPGSEEVISILVELVSRTMIPGLPEGSAQVDSAAALGPDWTESVAVSIMRCIENLLRRDADF